MAAGRRAVKVETDVSSPEACQALVDAAVGELGRVGLSSGSGTGRGYLSGYSVPVVDPAPGSGASHAAAGMLSPAGELWHGEIDLFRVGRASADLWPAFAALAEVPMLVIHGALSDILSVDTVTQMAERHPGLAVHTVSDQGHAPLLWDGVSQQAILDFLAPIA